LRFGTCLLRSVRPFTAGAVHLPRSPPLLWPLLTSRSAAWYVPSASSFQKQGEISPDKTIDCPCTSAGFTRHPFGRKSFAVSGPLALVSPASYPVSVRRPAGPATPLPSACLSRFPPCGSLGSLRPTPQRTSTSTSMFMLGIPQTQRPASLDAGRVRLSPAV
jgi:hypothetical protein